jgi:polar amino acid transport system substrate-binding protein
MRLRRASFPLAPVGAALVAALTLTACGSSASGSDSGGAAAASTEINGITVNREADAAAKLPDQYKKSIRIVTSAPYAPFETFDDNQKLVGLDIDLGNAIAATLGTRAEWTSIDYNGVIPALQAGKYDMVLASIGDTPEREKVLDFVNYSKQGQVLLVPKGNPAKITGLQDLCGTTMAVESGNVTEGYFKELDDYCTQQGKGVMAVKELPKTSDALLSLKSGQAASVYIGVATAADLMTRPDGADYEVVTPANKPFGYLPRWVGAGIPKNSPELRDAVEAALKTLLADGTLQKLYDKYGQGQILIDDIVVNKIVEEKLLS